MSLGQRSYTAMLALESDQAIRAHATDGTGRRRLAR